jgi:hypothetical protein
MLRLCLHVPFSILIVRQFLKLLFRRFVSVGHLVMLRFGSEPVAMIDYEIHDFGKKIPISDQVVCYPIVKGTSFMNLFLSIWRRTL